MSYFLLQITVTCVKGHLFDVCHKIFNGRRSSQLIKDFQVFGPQYLQLYPVIFVLHIVTCVASQLQESAWWSCCRYLNSFTLLYQGYLPASANEANLFIFCGMCLFRSSRYFFHNFRGLKWIPLQKRMAPNFKTTTLAHSRLSLLLNNNNIA